MYIMMWWRGTSPSSSAEKHEPLRQPRVELLFDRIATGIAATDVARLEVDVGEHDVRRRGEIATLERDVRDMRRAVIDGLGDRSRRARIRSAGDRQRSRRAAARECRR